MVNMTKDSEQPPKVVFVSIMAGVAWGGSEELWSRTALRLRDRGHEVGASVFEWASRPAPVTGLIDAGVDVVFRSRRKSLPGRLLEKWVQRLAPGPIDHQSMAWLKKESPDLVVISQGGPWEGVAWMNACKELGLRYCAIVQAHSEIWWPMDDCLEEIRNGYFSAERVFFVSQSNFELMERQCGKPMPHGEAISNPWNVNVSVEVPWPEDDGVTRIACVGRLDPQAKGQDVLFQVLAMPKWRERRIEVNLYGSGPCRESLEALAKMLDLQGVRLVGQVSSIEEIWAKNHALILPSRFEGLPLVIVEAMLCGRMVITSNVAGNAQYLREGVTGFIAEAPTPALLDDALERAWGKRGDWEAMGKTARRDALDVLPSDPIESFTDKLTSLVR